MFATLTLICGKHFSTRQVVNSEAVLGSVILNIASPRNKYTLTKKSWACKIDFVMSNRLLANSVSPTIKSADFDEL